MSAADIAMVQEEKKSQDVSLVDGDAEMQHWEEDPEKAYLSDSTQEREGEDRFLGSRNTEQTLNRHEDTQSFLRNDPNAPFRLAVLGPEDDLSTLAGDTIGGTVVTEGAVFSNANLPYAIMTKPRPRDFKEYDQKDLTTPTKKKRWHPYMDQGESDGDDQTQPETPHGGGGGVKAGDLTSQSKDDEVSSYFTHARPSKKVYICAAVIGFILLAAIVGLTVAYTQLSDDGNDSSSSSQSASVNAGGFDLEDLSPTILAPSAPTRAPVVVPTRPPVPVDGDALLALTDLLTKKGVNTAILEDTNSPQYRALIWLSSDPNYNGYTEPRLIQRWTLAVLALGLYTDDARVNSAADVLPLWLDYDTNECDWFTTRDGIICNGFGYYEYLSLDNQNLTGTIPSELGLLSDTLLFINFSANRLEGTIPTEIGTLLLLNRLRMRNNEFEGSVPSELGQLTAVDMMALGNNYLTGTIPREIRLLANLTELDMEGNRLTGPVPAEIGDLKDLRSLLLDDNQLSGTIPTEIGNLGKLKDLFVGHNNITGEVPAEVCGLGLSKFEADCQLVRCSCCTACAPTAAPSPAPLSPGPTGAPTLPGTPSPSVPPTMFPTGLPSVIPTAVPTVCADSVQWVPACIDAGEDLVVQFQNCAPQFGDWIGIYSSNADPTNLPSPFLWVWACGSQSCRGSPIGNTVTLNQSAADSQSAQAGTAWPLVPDDYVAYLIRNAGPPYVAVVGSPKMKIQQNAC